MNDYPEIEAIARRQGWSNKTQGELALHFIESAGLQPSFLDYLEHVADFENEGAEE